ncbi:MAG: hypothetical protein WDM89_19605, partial [Rhizomicrobium sp.]
MLADNLYGERVALHFHAQCFLADGHFAGTDAERAGADDRSGERSALRCGVVCARRLWLGPHRGNVLQNLKPAAKDKVYLGYSDLGYLLAGLYRTGFRVAHGPMPADLKRANGAEAVTRALRYLVERAPDTLEPNVSPDRPSAAFNITVLNHILGTALEPDLTGHVLMLEGRVGAYVSHRPFAASHHVVRPRSGALRGCGSAASSDVPPNDPDFGHDEEGRW